MTSKGRYKILQLLIQAKEVNISEIARRANLAHMSTHTHLALLKRIGMVEERTFGRIRLFRLREDDKKCQLIKEFFENARALGF